SDAHREAFFDWKLVGGELDHRRLVVEEGLRDGLVLLIGDAPLARDLHAPRERLRIEIVDRSEIARGEEVVADVLDSALDAPLLVGAVRRARAGIEAIVPGERG